MVVRHSMGYKFLSCSGELVRSFEAEANTNEICLHPNDSNVFIAAESSFGAVTHFDLRTPTGTITSSDGKRREPTSSSLLILEIREFGRYNGNVCIKTCSLTIAFFLEDNGDHKL